MKLQMKPASLCALLLCSLAFNTTAALAQTQRDPLGTLKRAITQAAAPALTTQQETDLNTLITSYRDSLPDEPDAALEAARDAYEAAILALNLTTAQTQAAAIAARSAELTNTRLRAQAQFAVTVLTNLKNGGQLTLLTEKLGSERVLALVNSLAGHGGGGPGGGGPGHGGPGGGRH